LAPFKITSEEPRVTIQVAGRTISFLLDKGASYLVLPNLLGKFYPSQISVVGVDCVLHQPKTTGPLSCYLSGVPFTHSFLILPSCPIPLLRRDLHSKLHFTFFFTTPPTTQDQSYVLFLMILTNCPPSSAPNSLPLPPDIVNPVVWDISSPSVASHHSQIKIYLKDPKSHPNSPQYPTSLKHRWGLKPLIDKLLEKEILKPTHFSCNTPILLVLKPDGSYRLFQDLRVVNLAVLPTHPVVPNPHTLLSLIPSDTSYFSVFDLKDTFFTLSLYPDCHNLFAFTWEDPALGLAQ
jgi:hypothetical protein